MPENITQTGPLSFRDIRKAVNSSFKYNDEAAMIEAQKLKELDNILSSPQYREEMTYSPEFGVKYDYTQEAIDAGLGESKYDDAVYSPSDLQNLNEVRAREQSGLQQLLNGLGKGGVIAATTFVDNFLGTAVGLVNLGVQGAKGNVDSWGEALNAFVDNPVSRYLQQINNKAEGWMPNYQTEYEQNLSWWEKLGTANFWGDHFLKNTGFFVGAYASGMLTAGLMTKAMQVDKMKSVFKGVVNSNGEALKSASDVLKAYKTGDAIMDGKQLTDNLAKAAKQIKAAEYTTKIAAGISGSIGESRMEALSGSEEDYNYRHQLLMQAKERDLANIDNVLMEQHPEWYSFTLPTEGQPATKPQLTSKEGLIEKERLIRELNSKYEKYETELANERINFANTAFLLNLAVTSADNIFQFGEAFTGGLTKARKIASVKKTAEGIYKKSPKDAIEGMLSMVSSPIAEGTQEMLQASITKAGERWNASRFNEFYGSALDPKALEAKETYMSTFFDAVGDTYTNLDDWENFFLGALTSLIPMPGGGARIWTAPKVMKEANQQSQAVADAMNKFAQDPNKREWLFHLSRLSSAEAKQDEALASNDSFSFKNAEMEKAISSVIAYTQGDKFQDYLDLIEQAYDVTEEDIDSIKALSVDKETGKSLFDGMTNKEILAHFKNSKKQALENANRIYETYNSMSALFNGRSNEFINTATYLVSTIDDREKRIKQITENVINDLNQNIGNFNEMYGHDPIEVLKNIGEMNTYFSEEDKALLQETIATKQEKKTFEILQRRQKAKARRKKQSGKILGYSNPIRRLEAKQASEGLTEQEEKTLQKYKDKQQKAKNSMDRAIQTIEDLKEYVYNTEDVSKTHVANIREQLVDLTHLLNERELLVDNLNTLQKNPEVFEESLMNDVINSYNTFVKNKRLKDYNSLKRYTTNRRKAIKEFYDRGLMSLDGIEEIATEKNDEDVINDVKEIRSLISLYNRISNIIKDPNKRIYDVDDPHILKSKKSIEDDLFKLLKDVYDVKIAIKLTEDFLEEQANFSDPITSKLAFNILKEFKKSKENTTSASNKKTTTEDPEEKSNKASNKSTLSEMKNNPNRESIINSMSKEEVIDFIIETELYNQMHLDPEELSNIDEDSLRGSVLLELEYVKEDTPNTEDEENEEAEEIEDKDDDTDSDDDVISVDSDTNPVEAPKRKVVTKESSSKDAVFDSSMKIGNFKSEDADDYSEAKPLGADYGWTVGQKSSKYEIGPLADPNERKLVEREKSWYTQTLNNLKAQEFVDSGELSKLWLLAESVGKQLPVTFVQLRNQGKSKESNSKGKNSLFLAVDWEAVEEINELLPEDKQYKKPEGYFEYTFFKTGIDRKSKMQVIGKFDYDKGSEPHEKLLNFVREEVSTIKHVGSGSNPLQTKFAASSVVTTLDWVFSGRLVKQNETFTSIAQRDLTDIIPKEKDSEELVNLDGEIQLALITPRGEVVVGEDLDGEVIELNINRPQSPVSHSDRRLATPWIKIREADGRVYYKAIRIKKFDKTYDSDDSPIAQRIKQALVNISKTTDETLIKNNLSALRKYLYIPSDKKLFVNTKNGTLNRGDQSISLDSTAEELYDFIKEQGYIFTFGLDSSLSLMDTINSNIFTTDLAQLHNANASMIVGKVSFKASGDYSVQPHESLVNRLIQEVHLGKKGFQPGRGFSAPVKIYGDDTSYVKSDNGTYYIEVDGHREEAKKLKPTQKMLIDFMVNLPNMGPDDGYYFGGRKGARGTIRIFEHKVGTKVYYITNKGRILTNEETSQFNLYKQSEKGSSVHTKAEEYLNEHLKGKPKEVPELTEKDLLDNKKEVIKLYMQSNNVTELSNSELKDIFKYTRKQLKELKDLLAEDDTFIVDDDGVKIREAKKEEPKTTEVLKSKVSNTSFKSRKRAVRNEKRAAGNTGGENKTVLPSKEIEKIATVLGNLFAKIPQSLQGLEVEILRLLPNKKSIAGFEEWLINTLSNKDINTNKLVEYYNQAFAEKFTQDSTVENLLKEIKQILEC